MPKVFSYLKNGRQLSPRVLETEKRERDFIKSLSNPKTQLLARRHANSFNNLILDPLKWKQSPVFLAAA